MASVPDGPQSQKKKVLFSPFFGPDVGSIDMSGGVGQGMDESLEPPPPVRRALLVRAFRRFRGLRLCSEDAGDLKS